MYLEKKCGENSKESTNKRMFYFIIALEKRLAKINEMFLYDERKLTTFYERGMHYILESLTKFKNHSLVQKK